MSEKKIDEANKITFHFIYSDKVTPAEISLIENQLGELVKQIIREENKED